MHFPTHHRETTVTEFTALGLPIILTSIFIFIASAVIHTAMPWHKDDFSSVPDEDAARAAIGGLQIPPGDYLMPKPASAAEMQSAEYKAKRKQGPVMLFTMLPNGEIPMGPIFIRWMVYLIVVTAFVALLSGAVLAPGASSPVVWHTTGGIAFMAYGMAQPQSSIWYHRKWSTTVKGLFDAAIYGVITAVVFGWLWP